MQTVRAGVIGVGHLGYHHARLYAAMTDCRLAGICDVDEERGKSVAKEFGAPFFNRYEDLIENGVEAVSVAVPTSLHKPVVLDLLGAGVDTLVEKPIAATAADAREMVDAAAKTNRVLQVGHVERFNSAVMALMDAFREPKFIEVHRLSPYPSRGADVSVVHDLMIHDIEIAMALDGTEVISVDAVGLPIFSESEDIANARLRFASGCVANITASRVSVDTMRKIRIFGNNAYVSTDYAAQEVLVYRKKPGTLPPGASPMEMIEIEPLELRREEPLLLELASFIACVRERGRPIVSGEDGLKALELGERIITSVRDKL